MPPDRDAERAVEHWIRLGDEVMSGKMGGEREARSKRSCTACGTSYNILGSDNRAVCARCFLERGANRRSE